MESTKRSGESGAIVVWFAFMLLLSLGFVALGIDVAKLAATRTQLQNAADAAALAGASAVDPVTGDLDEAEAIARAQETCVLNKAFVNEPEPVVLNGGDVSFPGNGRIRVVVSRDGGASVVAHIAQVLGVTSFQISATATAEAQPVSSIDCGVVPLAVSPPPGPGFQTGSDHVYSLKQPSSGGANGNYGALRLPACAAGAGCSGGGASEWSCMMANGYCCELAIGTTVTTQPGNMSGPLRSAIDQRFKSDKVRTENISYDKYVAEGGTGDRVVCVPFTNSVPNGSGPVTITGFGFFFIRNKPGSGASSSLSGEFLYQTVPGSGGGKGGGPFALSIRLVPNS